MNNYKEGLRRFLIRYCDYCDGCFYCEWDFQMSLSIAVSPALRTEQIKLLQEKLNVSR
jgi:hypothetical protein